MFCSNCGTQIPDDSKFCPNCGAKSAAPAGGQPQQGQPQQAQYNQPQQGQYNQPQQGQPQQQYNQQQQQFNQQQQQYNQQAQWANQAAPTQVKSGGNLLVKLGIGVAAALAIFIGASMFLGGGDDHGSGSGKTGSAQSGSTQVSLPDPSTVISLDDFKWLYNPRNYDSSGDIPVTEAYSPSGVWKVTIWRRPSKKADYRKELYLLDLNVEGRPRVVGSEAGAVDVYGYQGFLNSDEAKEAGLDQNNTAGDLLQALQEGDGTLPCTGTLLLLLVEDENGNLVQPKKETIIDLTGKYSPSRRILQLKDEKGNEYGTHAFVKSGDEEHSQGAYSPAKFDSALNGMIGMCRDCE